MLRAQHDEQFIEFKIKLARLTALMEQVISTHEALQKQTTAILDQLAKGEVPDVDVLLVARLQLEQQISIVKKESTS